MSFLLMVCQPAPLFLPVFVVCGWGGWGGVGWGMLMFLFLAHMLDATQCTCRFENARMVDATQCTCLSEPARCYAAHFPSEISTKDRNTRGVNARLLEYMHSFQFRFNNKLWKSTGEACKER